MGTDDAIDSDVDQNGNTDYFTLAAGQAVANKDAGLKMASVSGRMFADDGDGIQEADEGGMTGTVTLIDQAGSPIQSATTDAGGYYTLGTVAPGTYRVRFVPDVAPAGGYSPKNAGGDPTLDSDVNVNGTTDGFTVAAGQNVQFVAAGVPTAGPFIWVYNGAGAGDWSTPANWNTNRVPGSFDDVIFDRLRGDTNAALNSDRTMNSVTTRNGFGGTVDTDGFKMTVTGGGNWASGDYGRGELVLAGGTFTWTGGRMNSTSVLSTLTVKAAATFVVSPDGPSDPYTPPPPGNPYVGTTLTLGDSLEVEAGGTVLFSPTTASGTTFVNGAQVTNRGTIQIETAFLTGGSSTPAVVTNYGTVSKLLSTPKTTTMTNMAVVNAGSDAVLEVGAKTVLDITGKVIADPTWDAVSVHQKAGTTKLGAGTKLYARYGYQMDGGQLVVPGDASGAKAASDARLAADPALPGTDQKIRFLGGSSTSGWISQVPASEYPRCDGESPAGERRNPVRARCAE